MSDLVNRIITKGTLFDSSLGQAFNRVRSVATQLDEEILVQVAPGDLEPVTISEIFKKKHEFNDNTAMFYKKSKDSPLETISYRQYYRDAFNFSKALISVGCEPRSVVTIKGFNHPRWNTAFVGTILSNMVSAGIYPTNGPEATKYIMNHTDCKVTVVDTIAHANAMLALMPSLPSLKYVVVFLEDPTEEQKKKGAISWDDFLKLGEKVNDEEVDKRINDQKPGQCAILVYTSGTTGNPKGVMLSHDTLTYAIRSATDLIIVSEHDRTVSFLPLSHVAGCMLDTLMPLNSSHAVYFAQADALKGSLVDTLKEASPTIFFSVPRAFEKIHEVYKTKLEKMSVFERFLFEKAHAAVKKDWDNVLETDRFSELCEATYDPQVFYDVSQNENIPTSLFDVVNEAVKMKHDNNKDKNESQSSTRIAASSLNESGNDLKDDKGKNPLVMSGRSTSQEDENNANQINNDDHHLQQSSEARKNDDQDDIEGAASTSSSSSSDLSSIDHSEISSRPFGTTAISRIFYSMASKVMKRVVIDRIKKQLGLENCHYFGSGAAPLDPSTRDFFMGLDMPLCDLFGLSESCGMIGVGFPSAHSYKSGKSPILKNVEVSLIPTRLLKGHDDVLPSETVQKEGELCFRGRTMLMGYYKDKKATDAAIDVNGFFNTGDICTVDVDGFIQVVGRTKELLITAGGENVAPIPLETDIKNALHLLVSNVMVIGDKKKFLACLLTLQQDANGKLPRHARNFLKSCGISTDIDTASKFVRSKEALAVIEKGIIEANKNAPSRAQIIQKCYVIETEFSEATGELTPTLKLKRKITCEKFKEAITKIYDERIKENIISDYI